MRGIYSESELSLLKCLLIICSFVNSKPRRWSQFVLIIHCNGNLSIFADKFINRLVVFQIWEGIQCNFSRWEQRQHTATLIASLDGESTNNLLLRANGYCSFLDRWIADSSSWIFQNSSFLDSQSSTLDPWLSILASRNLNVSTFAKWELSLEDRVKTVNLLYTTDSSN